jgi:hypothetical protein
MRTKLLLPLVACLFLLSPRPAAASDVNPVFLALGGLKAPGLAFDIVGAAFARPQISLFEADSRMHRSVRAAFASHLVSLGLHTASIGAFVVGAVGDWEEAIGPVFLINAGCDIAIGVMGLLTGVDILLAKQTVDIKGTSSGIATSWSGVLNIAMGTFGILWFSPMLIGGVIGISELAALDPDPRIQRVALRARPPRIRAAVVPSPGGLTVLGTF